MEIGRPASTDWDPSTARGQDLVPLGPMRRERELPFWPGSKTVATLFGGFGEGLETAGIQATPACH